MLLYGSIIIEQIMQEYIKFNYQNNWSFKKKKNVLNKKANIIMSNVILIVCSIFRHHDRHGLFQQNSNKSILNEANKLLRCFYCKTYD